MEFIDKIRDNEDYYDFLDSDLTITAKKYFLKYYICKDKYFFEPYILLSQIYFNNEDEIDQGFQILRIAYKRVMKDIFPNKKLPNSMNWYEINNRHIFRLLYNYANALWFIGLKNKADNLFKHLIKMHPDDNIGARYSALGIHEGFGETYSMWNELNDVEKWFQSILPKYEKKKGFAWVKKYKRIEQCK